MSHDLPLILNRRFVRATHPIPHRSRQRLGSIRFLNLRSRWGVFQDIVRKSIAPLTPIRRTDGCCSVTTLLKADIAVGGVIVAGADLELRPRSREMCAALNTAFEGLRQGDESSGAGAELDRFEGMIEVGAGGAVAVPVVVVEEVLLLLGGFVAEDYAWAAVGVAGMGLGNELLYRTVGEMGRVVGCGVAIVVGD